MPGGGTVAGKRSHLNIPNTKWCIGEVTHLFSFIHGFQNGHVQLFQSRQDADVLPQVRSEVLWGTGRFGIHQNSSAHATLGRCCDLKHHCSAFCCTHRWQRYEFLPESLSMSRLLWGRNTKINVNNSLTQWKLKHSNIPYQQFYIMKRLGFVISLHNFSSLNDLLTIHRSTSVQASLGNHTSRRMLTGHVKDFLKMSHSTSSHGASSCTWCNYLCYNCIIY